MTREPKERFQELLARAATEEERASLAAIVNQVKAALRAAARDDTAVPASES